MRAPLTCVVAPRFQLSSFNVPSECHRVVRVFRRDVSCACRVGQPNKSLTAIVLCSRHTRCSVNRSGPVACVQKSGELSTIKKNTMKYARTRAVHVERPVRRDRLNDTARASVANTPSYLSTVVRVRDAFRNPCEKNPTSEERKKKQRPRRYTIAYDIQSSKAGGENFEGGVAWKKKCKIFILC